jgi:predicted tellurium resistance membrane protein TerC
MEKVPTVLCGAGLIVLVIAMALGVFGVVPHGDAVAYAFMGGLIAVIGAFVEDQRHG